MGLLTDRINNKLEKSNLINEHDLNRKPVPLRDYAQNLEIGPNRVTPSIARVPLVLTYETFNIQINQKNL